MLIPDENYKKFSDKLTTSRWGKKGFRLPDLRIYVKNILKEGNWEEYLGSEPLFFEDVMMHSFVIAGTPIKIEERFLLLENFFHLMDNWSFVDILCCLLC